ncbi:hypothetical protein HBB16_07420 [Pseudonocardia sp. MCCB 268]|nr:hypothetical protein [Pseudonocardia cytotoxica]
MTAIIANTGSTTGVAGFYLMAMAADHAGERVLPHRDQPGLRPERPGSRPRLPHRRRRRARHVTGPQWAGDDE